MIPGGERLLIAELISIAPSTGIARPRATKRRPFTTVSASIKCPLFHCDDGTSDVPLRGGGIVDRRTGSRHPARSGRAREACGDGQIDSRLKLMMMVKVFILIAFPNFLQQSMTVRRKVIVIFFELDEFDECPLLTR